LVQIIYATNTDKTKSESIENSNSDGVYLGDEVATNIRNVSDGLLAAIE
jgi:hypothetical protein